MSKYWDYAAKRCADYDEAIYCKKGQKLTLSAKPATIEQKKRRLRSLLNLSKYKGSFDAMLRYDSSAIKKPNVDVSCLARWRCGFLSLDRIKRRAPYAGYKERYILPELEQQAEFKM